MTPRYRPYSAVMLLLSREGADGPEYLLQKRQNTGYLDGCWDCAASGHVEKGEPLSQAMAREAAEELGIEIDRADLHFAGMIYKCHQDNGDSYFTTYFWAERYQGQPHIHEPEKCSDLAWFPLAALPEELISDRRQAIERHRQGLFYLEDNWHDETPAPQA